MPRPNSYCHSCYAAEPDSLDSGYCDFCGEKLVLPLKYGKVCDTCGHWEGRDDLRSCDVCHPHLLSPNPDVPASEPDGETNHD